MEKKKEIREMTKTTHEADHNSNASLTRLRTLNADIANWEIEFTRLQLGHHVSALRQNIAVRAGVGTVQSPGVSHGIWSRSTPHGIAVGHHIAGGARSDGRKANWSAAVLSSGLLG